MKTQNRAKLSTVLWVYVGLVLFSSIGSGISSPLHVSSGPVGPIAAALILIAGCLGCVETYRRRASSLWPLLLVLVLGACAELLGVATGFPFGAYKYTGAWYPSLQLPIGTVSILVPLAWLLVTVGSYLLVSGLSTGWARALLAAAAATGFDAAMEPVLAGKIGYWRWLSPGALPGGAPIQNFVSWFVLTLVAAAILQVSDRKEPNQNDFATGAVLIGGQLLLLLALWIV